MRIRLWLPALLCVAFLSANVSAGDKDLLDSVKEQAKIEAQRVEREFADGRLAAYKLVRSDDPKLSASLDRLETLLEMIEKDTALGSYRRQQLIVTLKADMKEVRRIAAERARPSRIETPKSSDVKRETPRRYDNDREAPRRYDDDRRPADRDAKSTIDRRKEALKGSRDSKAERNESLLKMRAEAEKSFSLEARRFPPDWLKKSQMRSEETKLTAKEKAILTALDKTIDADFEMNTLTEILAALKKSSGIDFIVDPMGLRDAGVNYDSQVRFKGKATTRSVIKRVLADLGLGYYIKDEALQITSVERARAQTTVRTYYIGDLAGPVDFRLPTFVSQIQVLENVGNLITLIKKIDPQSWKDINPDAHGEIYFNPVTMKLVVKQTSEIHYKLGSKW